MAHKDICIKFEVEGHRFEALGYPSKVEPPFDCDDNMFQHVPNVIGKEDEAFLWKHRGQLPEELRSYCLVTNQGYPDNSHHVSCFEWYDDGWERSWSWLAMVSDDDYLVIGRCA